MEEEACITQKELESDVGFLIYVARTFSAMRPYLKGFHLTLHGWRQGRDDTGWKSILRDEELDKEDLLEDEEHFDLEYGHSIKEPTYVKPVPRLSKDVQALHALTESPTPPMRIVRPNQVRSVCYGFGDASGAGFGSTFTSPEAIRYRHGIWGRDEEGNSSNWRELTNLVETLEEEATEERIQGCEIFMFTDNSTAEAAFFRVHPQVNGCLT